MQLRVLTNADQLSEHAEAWDDLWSRSAVALPTAQASPLLLWLDHFASRSDFRAVVVEQDGRFVAALPLVSQRLAGMLPVGRVTHSDWSTGGELLLDPNVDAAEAVRMMLAGLKEFSWPLLYLSGCRVDLPGWGQLFEQCDGAGHTMAGHRRFESGLVRVPHDFEEFKKSWSRNHRRQMRKAQQKIEEQGECQLQLHNEMPKDQVEPLLRSGFEIEHRGWKGEAGSSVLAIPGMFDFYLQQAENLAESGHLQLAFLTLEDRPIAFEYGWRSKGHHFTPKVAYDEQFARYKPGQLLRYRFLERLSEECPSDVVDFLGPLSEATSKWATSSYMVDTILVAMRPVLGGATLAGYRLLRRLRRLPQVSSTSVQQDTSLVPLAT